MNFLAVGLCIGISTGLLYYYMKLHNAWLLKTSSEKQNKTKQNKQKNNNNNNNNNKTVTMGLDNTAKAVDHVKIESI